VKDSLCYYCYWQDILYSGSGSVNGNSNNKDDKYSNVIGNDSSSRAIT